MNKWVAALFFLLVPCVCLAQQNISARTLAADQLFVYGKAVYERGDYPEAAAVLSRVLMIDPHHMEALNYAKALRQKGQNVFIPPVIQEPAVTIRPQPAPEKSIETIPAATAPSADNGDLKQKIQEAEHSIEKLKVDIADLNTQIAQGQKDLRK